MFQYIYAIGLGFLILVGFPMYFLYVIPWHIRRRFKKYFAMTVVPENGEEKALAKPYLTARLRQYNAAYEAVDGELKQHLGLPEISDKVGAETRIKKLREIRKSLDSARSKYDRANQIYDKLYPIPEMQHGGVGGQVRA